jgi:DNA-binding NtrC family response regulator
MRLHLLIVDDDLVTRSVLQARYRQRPELEVSIAASGEQALAHLSAHRVHILCADLQMPGMDGLALMRDVRSRWPLVRTIIVTGQVQLTTMLTCIGEGAFTFVTKPLGDFADLDCAIDTCGELVRGWMEQLERLRRLSREAG